MIRSTTTLQRFPKKLHAKLTLHSCFFLFKILNNSAVMYQLTFVLIYSLLSAIISYGI